MFTTATFTDDIYSRDPTTVQLETEMAALTGHESALFVVSGTMGNQLSLRTHLSQPPHSVLCDESSHIFVHEAGGLAMFSQAQMNTIKPKNGRHITLEEVKAGIVPDDDDHYAPTMVVSMENTLNGMVMPYVEAKRISEFIREEYKGKIKLHLDGTTSLNLLMEGARLWNGVVAEKISIKQYCSLFDSVSLCFSKGMSTPVGSVIVGSSAFVKKARHFKKAFGGGIRNPGILTSACLTSLKQIMPRIEATHIFARELATRIEGLGYRLTHPVETTMIWLNLDELGIPYKSFVDYCAREGVTVFDFNRIVIHHQTTQEAADKLITALTRLMEDVKGGILQT